MIETSKQLEDPLQYFRISLIRSYSSGESVYRPGDPASHVYLVMSGAVNVGRILGAGRETVTKIYRSDSIFGEAALIESHRTGIATALEQTKLMAWTAGQIEAMGAENPKLLYALLQTMVSRVVAFEDRIASFTVDDARRRLVRALIEFSKEGASETADAPAWIPPVTHEWLAAYIGISREGVTQFMNLLRRQGYLNYSRKGVLVFRDRLEQLLADEDRHLAGAPATPDHAEGRHQSRAASVIP